MKVCDALLLLQAADIDAAGRHRLSASWRRSVRTVDDSPFTLSSQAVAIGRKGDAPCQAAAGLCFPPHVRCCCASLFQHVRAAATSRTLVGPDNRLNVVIPSSCQMCPAHHSHSRPPSLQLSCLSSNLFAMLFPYSSRRPASSASLSSRSSVSGRKDREGPGEEAGELLRSSLLLAPRLRCSALMSSS
jgi:hypothetical protein